MQFEIGTARESAIVERLGSPSTRIEKKGYYTLIYNGGQTGLQRLSLNFDNNKILSSLLWIPAENENEISLERAMAGFKGANFKVSEKDDGSTHAISKITFYTDETSGTTIRYNPSSQYVEGIAKFDIKSRAPTATPLKRYFREHRE